MFTLPSGIAPASFNFFITVASYVDMYESLRNLEPHEHGWPSTLMRSFIDIGIPPRGFEMSAFCALLIASSESVSYTHLTLPTIA